MSRHKKDFLIPALYVLADALAVESAFLIAYFLRFSTGLFTFLPLTEDLPPLRAYILSSLVVIPIWLLIFESGGMYAARRNVTLTEELFRILRHATLGMLVILSIAFFYRAFSYSRVVFIVVWVLAIIMLFIGRAVVRGIERNLYRRGRELRNAAVIGSNAMAEQLCTVLQNHPLLGYRIVGYFQDEQSAPNGMPVPCLGTVAEAPELLISNDIELALISLDYSRHHELSRLVRDCEGINVEFMLVPDILELMTSRMAVKEIDGIPLIKIKGMPMTPWGRIIKRAFDLVISLLLLLVLLPVLAILAVIVKLDSPGPVFYMQERLGEDGRKFRIFKFRSMRVDAEMNGPVWSSGKSETRHTRSGKWLRMTSLDELPQLINVARGEMSLVGPRPERPYFVEQFKEVVPKYLDRHRVKAGMTGWAQVNGLRGDSSLEERIKYDIYYIENWSLGFDIRILIRTAGEVLHQVIRYIKKA